MACINGAFRLKHRRAFVEVKAAESFDLAAADEPICGWPVPRRTILDSASCCSLQQAVRFRVKGEEESSINSCPSKQIE